MIPKTSQEKLELKVAYSKYRQLKKDKPLYNSTLNTILQAFSSARIPNFGSFIFNKQKI
jgi:hypothetical protein